MSHVIPAWSTITEEVRARCAPAGVDLVQPFRVEWYNSVIDKSFQLPDFGRPAALGLLIGNTRALWPRFIAALRDDPARMSNPHPLDRWTAELIDAALRPLTVRWEWRAPNDPPPRRVGMQRLAHASGLAWLSPSHLNVHPIFGPWIAFRAAVVIDVDGPPGPPPNPPAPCDLCSTRCMPAFERAIAATGNGIAAHADVAPNWRLWLAARSACPVGAEHRYDDAHAEYHYTKNAAILRSLVS